MSEQAEAAQVLEDAADLLLIRGRCTGEPEADDGRLCVRGAIQVAEGVAPVGFGLPSTPAVFALERHLIETPFAARYIACSRASDPEGREVLDGWERDRRFPAWIWNDKQRGEEGDFEVIDTLRLVAKDLRNGAAS